MLPLLQVVILIILMVIQQVTNHVLMVQHLTLMVSAKQQYVLMVQHLTLMVTVHHPHHIDSLHHLKTTPASHLRLLHYCLHQQQEPVLMAQTLMLMDTVLPIHFHQPRSFCILYAVQDLQILRNTLTSKVTTSFFIKGPVYEFI